MAFAAPTSRPAFLPPARLPALPRRRGPDRSAMCPPRAPPRFRMSLPTQERVLRLERALAAAIQQERYTDAANLRDALQQARTSDPMLSARAALDAAVAAQDFVLAARLRDDLAALVERLARRKEPRRIDRLVVLRGRADPSHALRVATFSRDGLLPLPLEPPIPAPVARDAPPRVYLQPTWSPSGDFVAMTEIAFHVDAARAARGLAVAETAARVIIMNAFDGSLVKAVELDRPPFFYFWAPDGRSVTLLSNDPSSPSTTVALSYVSVIAPPGSQGVDPDHVSAPIATGHPFLYDICPRDATRLIAHMGDSASVALMRLNARHPDRVSVTEDAGLFGTPQWHPHAGADGREVVFFVEKDAEQNARRKREQAAAAAAEAAAPPADGPVGDTPASSSALATTRGADAMGAAAGASFEKFVANGTTLFESVLRKGAESLGLTDFKFGRADTDKILPFLNPGSANGNGKADDTANFGRIEFRVNRDDDDDDDDDDVSSKIKGEDDDDDDANELPDIVIGGVVDGDVTDASVMGAIEIVGEDTIELEVDPEETVESLKEKLRSLLSKRLKDAGSKWGSGEDDIPIYSRLVMADADQPELRRVVCNFAGNMAFKLSPCGKHLATLVTNPSTGQDEFTIVTGDFSPDSVAASTGPSLQFPRLARDTAQQSDADIILSTPSTRVLAFFWSPDASKLLFLSSLRGSKIGAAQWATFDMANLKVVRYEKFVMSGIYMHCLNFFDQFATSMTPWSPDSDAFTYPGRPLTSAELERDEEQDAASTSALSALFIQRDGAAEGKRFSARLQRVPSSSQAKLEPDDAETVVENVEYVCWSPC